MTADEPSSNDSAGPTPGVSAFDPVTHDLTHTLSRYLDLHLVFPLLEFLQSRDLYDETEVLEGKIQLLKKTNMVDFAMEIYMVRVDRVGKRGERERAQPRSD